MVRAFHAHFGLPIGDTSRTTNEVRIRLVQQESVELVEALKMFDADPTSANLCAVAHESADVLFAVYGTALTLNYDADEAARQVFLANLTRQGADATGKVVKGPNYVPPDLRSAIKGLQR